MVCVANVKEHRPSRTKKHFPVLKSIDQVLDIGIRIRLLSQLVFSTIVPLLPIRRGRDDKINRILAEINRILLVITFVFLGVDFRCVGLYDIPPRLSLIRKFALSFFQFLQVRSRVIEVLL